MKKFAEVNGGMVRDLLLADFVPMGRPGVEWVDITDLSPEPQRGWLYDAGSRKFTPNKNNDPYDPIMLREAWSVVRQTRAIMLSETDYTQLKDYPDWIYKRRYREYRQDLRDIPEIFDDPYKVIYPNEPQKVGLDSLTLIEKIWYVWSKFKKYIYKRRR